ncbi:hypothetical protein N0V83_010933 [Neocucurbitaria cava]|uniref:Ankyrin repeat protein n=1 Tax=Neocucurbitaria cava TaxID=798079 RepID=A0A9W9CH68_9PLEO|nr:hypothetical protein N0V83_010933 [Neocucurbitaria cava]
MAQLLDMPPEMVKMIIAELVADVGVLKHDFNHVFFDRIKDLAAFLEHRVNDPDRTFKTLLNELCAGLTVTIDRYMISDAIIPGRVCAYWLNGFCGTFDAHVQLAAAISARCYDLVHELLRNYPVDSMNYAYGQPLFNVAKLGDERLLDILVHHLDSLLDSLQLDSPERENRLFNIIGGAFSVEEAIIRAIRYGHMNVIDSLLHIYQKYLHRVRSRTLNVWLEAAVIQGSVATVQALARIPHDPSFKIKSPTMSLILKTGRYDMVSAAFSLTSASLGHYSSTQHPLHIAVRSGFVDSVRAIVDTVRVDINALVKSGIPNYSRDLITALDLAIYHDYVDIVRYLVSQGAEHACLAPRVTITGPIYDILRQASIEYNVGYTWMPEYEDWKRMSFNDREDMASRQD